MSKAFPLTIGLAQLNATVGALEDNAQRIIKAYHELVARGAELVLTPELALPGYPPQDLLFKRRFVPAIEEIARRMAEGIGSVPLILGAVAANPSPHGKPFRNVAHVLQNGRICATVAKTLLPTYDVFDEDRYFEPATEWPLINVCGLRLGITICEDIWPAENLPRALYREDPARRLAGAGADLLLNLSASPYHAGKPAQRRDMVARLAAEIQLPIAYCNAIGGNDELVFDGSSFVVDSNGELLASAPAFEESLTLARPDGRQGPVQNTNATEEEEIYLALRLGLADYFRKCGFRSAVLGLSGGIDSALTACIAADALGADHVMGVTLPSKYSSHGSVEDSLALARNLGITCHQVPIIEPVEAFRRLLEPFFEGRPEDTADENIQPRVRATLLMALSNKLGSLLLTTGNKSELAVGYCTLYGDMAGGLAVISDIPKTLVYRIARWINRNREIIPTSTLEKPPSAELKPGQTDQDTLPPYEVLDPILEKYVEHHMSASDIIADGFDEETVRWVLRRVDLNEYKRKQAAPGLRVTSKAFGLGRRMPVAQRFVE